jgi:hypothetical protein
MANGSKEVVLFSYKNQLEREMADFFDKIFTLVMREKNITILEAMRYYLDNSVYEIDGWWSRRAKTRMMKKKVISLKKTDFRIT